MLQYRIRSELSKVKKFNSGYRGIQNFIARFVVFLKQFVAVFNERSAFALYYTTGKKLRRQKNAEIVFLFLPLLLRVVTTRLYNIVSCFLVKWSVPGIFPRPSTKLSTYCYRDRTAQELDGKCFFYCYITKFLLDTPLNIVKFTTG